MKTKIDAIIVVEGKSDIDFLSSFLDANFYKVNGSAVSEEDIIFLKNAKKTHDIIVLTDPDFPGIKIRNYINDSIPGLKNAFVRKRFSIKNHKVGVAESTKKEVLYALQNFIVVNKNDKRGNLTQFDFFELGLAGGDDSASKREIIDEKFHLGHSNAKTMLKKINMLGITRKELEDVLNAKN